MKSVFAKEITANIQTLCGDVFLTAGEHISVVRHQLPMCPLDDVKINDIDLTSLSELGSYHFYELYEVITDES